MMITLIYDLFKEIFKTGNWGVTVNGDGEEKKDEGVENDDGERCDGNSGGDFGFLGLFCLCRIVNLWVRFLVILGFWARFEGDDDGDVCGDYGSGR